MEDTEGSNNGWIFTYSLSRALGRSREHAHLKSCDELLWVAYTRTAVPCVTDSPETCLELALLPLWKNILAPFYLVLYRPTCSCMAFVILHGS
jgi:hypothetical protein